MAAKAQVVASSTGEKFTTELSIGQHHLYSDESASYGGSDRGPNPYDLLLCALGSCTVMTLSMYAKRKEWALERIEVSLNHEKSHAEDCGECENKGAKLDHITKEIKLIGDLDDGQRKRLLEIADKCPVHRTLTSEVKIKSVLKT